ncbi:hypothetical protein MASR2M48_21460 [Spirochaetota bacterium]
MVRGCSSLERAGTLPAGALAKLCFSGTVSEKDVMRMINGQGGMVSLAGTNDMRVLEDKHLKGDADASLVYNAFVIQRWQGHRGSGRGCRWQD